MYMDLRERRGGELVEAHISPEERHTLHGIIERHSGTILESLSRKLVAIFIQADQALECARDLRAAVIQFRNPPWGGVGFYTRTLLAPAPAGVRDPARWTELALKMSVHLNGTPPDCIIGLETFLAQLNKQPVPAPRPLMTDKGPSSLLFTLTGDRRADVEEAATRAASAMSGAGVGLFGELAIKIGDRTRIINPPECPLSVGRSKTCAIMLQGDDVSRVHGRIEFSNDKYFYVDDSRNGSYVLTQDGNEVRLEKERLLLIGEGVISPGVPMLKQKGQVIHYRCAAIKLSLGDDAPTKPR
jgi:hypothetical protein